MSRRLILTPALLVAVLMMSLSSPLSMANGTRIPLTAAENAAFNSEAALFLNLSNAEVRDLIEVRNAKGIRRFKTFEGDNVWDQKDPAKGDQQGTATETAYKEFGAGTKEVIVAVMDSGGDINHEDMQGKIWTNAGESGDGKENNGIDDDKNGYIDDVHGWNFLGGKKDGKIVNVIASTLEAGREYARLSVLEDAGKLPESERPYLEALFKVWKKYADRVQSRLPTYKLLDRSVTFLEAAGLSSSVILSEANISTIAATNSNITRAKEIIIKILRANPTAKLTAADIHRVYKQELASAAANASLTFTSSTVVGDDETKLQPVCATAFASEKDSCIEVGYGNNDVTGAAANGSLDDSSHGTHVGGIIGAIRGNGKGNDGQAEKVKIMHIRMVPDGDERDKDIANGIRYAVDNGAKVINQSFGKGFSPNKAWIDDAVKYAESKGVIIVHAAGNDGKNTERYDAVTREFNFPNKLVMDASGNTLSKANNWIEVGASAEKKDPLVAYFSNWGKTSVDLFAPGHEIYASFPNNEYSSISGTSMASPEVAGVVAYLLSVFPDATVAQVKDALMATTTQYGDFEVDRPGSPIKVKFSSLSTTGGIINTYEAAKVIKASIDAAKASNNQRVGAAPAQAPAGQPDPGALVDTSGSAKKAAKAAKKAKKKQLKLSSTVQRR